jgi:DNA-directed RNA polymerase specialized sigma24 family protein
LIRILLRRRFAAGKLAFPPFLGFIGQGEQMNAALDALAAEDPSLAQVIEMRYFGGMTAEETAEALGRSVHMVRHDIRYAQAWLRRSMRS